MIKFEDEKYIEMLDFCKAKFYENDDEKKHFIKENIKNNEDYFFLLYGICNLSQNIGFAISDDIGVCNNGNDATKYNKFKAIWIIHEQCVKLANEILILLLNGSVSGATIIQRTLFEYSVIAEFIEKHPETAITYFYNFNRQEKKYIDNLIKQIDNEKEPEYFEYLLELKKQDEEIIKELNFENGDYGWTCDKRINNFSKICEDVGQTEFYNIVYRYSSNYVHASSFRTIQNLDMGPDENRAMFSMQGQDNVFPYTYIFLHNVTLVFLNSYAEICLDFNRKIAVLSNGLQELIQVFNELLENKEIN